MSSYPCLDIELGTTLANLTNLKNLGIPDPDSWTFVPFSRVEVGGDGRPRGLGFATASLTWDVLSQPELNTLLSFIAANEASAFVFCWLYTDSGSGLGGMRARFYGILHRATDGNGKTLIANTTRPTFRDVTFTFSHLEAV